MAANLTSAGLSGSFNASGASSSFVMPLPSQPLSRGMSRPLFNVQATFSSDAVGTLSVTKSKDGGSTFAPVMAGQRAISVLAATGALNFQQLDPTWMYRLEATLSAGSIAYAVAPRVASTPIGMIDRQAGGDPNFPLSLMPAAGYWRYYGFITPFDWPTQAQKHYEAIWTPVQDSDIAGAFTAYKTLWLPGTTKIPVQNAFAKLSVPSSASRSRGYICYPGERREIRVLSAVVASLVDATGTSVSGAYVPYEDQTALLSVGSTLSGAYQDDDVRIGTVVFLTLIEAVLYQLQTQPTAGILPAVPNLSAIVL